MRFLVNCITMICFTLLRHQSCKCSHRIIKIYIQQIVEDGSDYDLSGDELEDSSGKKNR